jgi:hypothetical protein
LFKALNAFGNFAQPFHVPIRIPAALFVADHGEAFAESGG